MEPNFFSPATDSFGLTMTINLSFEASCAFDACLFCATQSLPWSVYMYLLPGCLGVCYFSCFACAFCAFVLHCLCYLVLGYVCGSLGASCASPTLSRIRSLGGCLGSDYSIFICLCPHWGSVVVCFFAALSVQRKLLLGFWFWQLPVLWFCFSLMLNCLHAVGSSSVYTG